MKHIWNPFYKYILFPIFLLVMVLFDTCAWLIMVLWNFSFKEASEHAKESIWFFKMVVKDNYTKRTQRPTPQPEVAR